MSDERHIEPSPQRRRQAIRQRGLPRSAELTTALLVLTTCGGLRWYLPDLNASRLQSWLAEWRRCASAVHLEGGQGAGHLLRSAALACGGALLIVWLITFGCVVIQGGWTWRPVIGFSGGRPARSPMAASPHGWTALVSGLKIVLLPLMLGWCLWQSRCWQLPRFSNSQGAAAEQFRGTADWMLSSLLFIAAGWFALGAVDYAFRVWVFRRSLRLSPAEWREELKRLEGRPPLRRLQR